MEVPLSYDSRPETYKHISQVQGFLGRVIANLLCRSQEHDRSKLASPEVEAFDENTPKLAATTYGSDEYKALLAAIKPALDHHYAENSHHPEHYRWRCPACKGQWSEKQSGVTLHPDDKPHRFCPRCCPGGTTIWECELDDKPEKGILGMSLLDLVEMLCDWKAATLRHNDGDIRKSIEINQKRFGYSDELKAIFLNTLPLIES